MLHLDNSSGHVWYVTIDTVSIAKINYNFVICQAWAMCRGYVVDLQVVMFVVDSFPITCWQYRRD